jgi:ribose-phosphate pyrophosphokinase
MTEPAKIFSGTATRYLAERIAQASGERLGEVILDRFSDGEFQPSFEETVRGDLVFIVQSTFPPADNLLELLMMVDAAKRASAKRIVAVIPYFGFARQDRKDKPRVSIGAKLVANMLTAAGVDRIMTMDLHADQIQGFFEVPVDHLFASTIFLPHIKQMGLKDLLMAAPDTGDSLAPVVETENATVELVAAPAADEAKAASAGKRRSMFSGLGSAFSRKKKKAAEAANQIERMTVIGDVSGKDVVLVDDMIDTAGTITKAADMMMELGANSVRALATHAVLSGDACKRIERSSLKELIVTDTIPMSAEKMAQTSKIEQLSVAQLFADVIARMRNHESISSHFIIA